MAIEMRDCASYPAMPTDDDGCVALEEMLCRNGKCKFYKTQSMLDEQNKKCYQRLKHMLKKEFKKK